MEEAFISEWPSISFEEIALKDEEGVSAVLYKSFFAVLRFPETMFVSLITLFKEEPNPVKTLVRKDLSAL